MYAILPYILCGRVFFFFFCIYQKKKEKWKNREIALPRLKKVFVGVRDFCRF